MGAEAEEAAEEKEEGQGQQGGAGGFLGPVATGPAILWNSIVNWREDKKPRLPTGDRNGTRCGRRLLCCNLRRLRHVCLQCGFV